MHDALEDRRLSFEDIARDFSPFVASLVLELTNDEDEMRRIGKLEYQKKKLVGISSYALTVKLADRLHNLADHPTAKTVEQTVELLQYLAANRKLTKTQEAMAAEILSLCK